MDIYEALDQAISLKFSRINFMDFSESIKDDITNERDKRLFEILKGIASLGYKVDENGITFIPLLIMEDKRSFSVEDITDEDYELLKSLECEKLPLNIRAKLADLLWVTKKLHTYALVGAVSYLKLFNTNFNDDDWVESLEYIGRALFITKQINNDELYKKGYDILYMHLVKINGNDQGFLSVKIVKIILATSKGCGEDILRIIENIIEIGKNKKNLHKVKEAYKLKISWLKKNKKQEFLKYVNLELADYYVTYADELVKENWQGYIEAERCYKEAVILFRNNGCPDRSSVTLQKLVLIQKKIPDLMEAHNFRIDISKIKKNIEENFDGLTFEQAIMRLAQLATFHKIEDIKKEVLDKRKKYVLSFLFGKSIINEQGQTVLTLPALALEGETIDANILELYVNQEMLQQQELMGNVFLRIALNIIKEKYSFDSEKLEFLVKNNPIIPNGRESVFRNAIYLGLTDQKYEAIHILAPQVENLFRVLAKELGDLTITLEDDGISKEKVLSAIFDLPELKDAYDNDILFEFKGILNEQSGANLRNRVAHGLLEPGHGESGVSIYFISIVIRLLSYTSKECYRILSTLPKYIDEDWNADDFKIVEE